MGIKLTILIVLVYSTLSIHSQQIKKEEILKRLKSVKTIDELYDEFNTSREIVQEPLNLWKRQAQPIIVSEQVACIPRKQCYRVPTKDTEPFFIFPSCIMVNRCGGCCHDKKLECVNATQSTKTVYVHKIPFHGSPVGLHRVQYTNDDTCACACRVKAHHCIKELTYDPHKCECVCKKSPVACGPNKQWSQLACGCVCQSSHDVTCSAERVWNLNTCQCECSLDKCPSGQTPDPKSCLCV